MIVESAVDAHAIARAAALELRLAARAVVEADEYRSPGPEIERLSAALLMFEMAATAARWVPVGVSTTAGGDDGEAATVLPLRGRHVSGARRRNGGPSARRLQTFGQQGGRP